METRSKKNHACCIGDTGGKKLKRSNSKASVGGNGKRKQQCNATNNNALPQTLLSWKQSKAKLSCNISKTLRRYYFCKAKTAKEHKLGNDLTNVVLSAFTPALHDDLSVFFSTNAVPIDENTGKARGVYSLIKKRGRRKKAGMAFQQDFVERLQQQVDKIEDGTTCYRLCTVDQAIEMISHHCPGLLDHIKAIGMKALRCHPDSPNFHDRLIFTQLMEAFATVLYDDFDDGPILERLLSGYVRVYSFIDATKTWTQLGSDIDGEAGGDVSGYSVSLSSDGKTVAIGAPYNGGNGSDSGHVRVYSFIDATKTWTQLGDDIDGEADCDKSGYSVSLSSDGKTVAIGARYNDVVIVKRFIG